MQSMDFVTVEALIPNLHPGPEEGVEFVQLRLGGVLV